MSKKVIFNYFFRDEKSFQTKIQAVEKDRKEIPDQRRSVPK